MNFCQYFERCLVAPSFYTLSFDRQIQDKKTIFQSILEYNNVKILNQIPYADMQKIHPHAHTYIHT